MWCAPYIELCMSILSGNSCAVLVPTGNPVFNCFFDTHSQKIALHQQMEDMVIRDHRALTMIKDSTSQDSLMPPRFGCECP